MAVSEEPLRKRFFSKPEWWVPTVAAVLAILAFGLVIWLSQKVVGVPLAIPLTSSQTTYAIFMGLLGSSLFLLYNVIGVIPGREYSPEDVPKNLAGLLVGPVAGWVSYFMYVTWRLGEAKQAGAAQIWLPFFAGFSADLAVGIINQGVRAVRYTLGLEKVEKADQKRKGE